MKKKKIIILIFLICAFCCIINENKGNVKASTIDTAPCLSGKYTKRQPALYKVWVSCRFHGMFGKFYTGFCF